MPGPTRLPAQRVPPVPLWLLGSPDCSLAHLPLFSTCCLSPSRASPHPPCPSLPPPTCSGTCAKLFKSEVQFGHAGAKSGGDEESAQARLGGRGGPRWPLWALLAAGRRCPVSRRASPVAVLVMKRPRPANPPACCPLACLVYCYCEVLPATQLSRACLLCVSCMPPAQAKNAALSAAGAIVPGSFEELEGTIRWGGRVGWPRGRWMGCCCCCCCRPRGAVRRANHPAASHACLCARQLGPLCKPASRAAPASSHTGMNTCRPPPPLQQGVFGTAGARPDTACGGGGAAHRSHGPQPGEEGGQGEGAWAGQAAVRLAPPASPASLLAPHLHATRRRMPRHAVAAPATCTHALSLPRPHPNPLLHPAHCSCLFPPAALPPGRQISTTLALDVATGAAGPAEALAPPSPPLLPSLYRPSRPHCLQVRAPTHIVSSICDDRGEEPTYAGVTMSELMEADANVGDAIGWVAWPCVGVGCGEGGRASVWGGCGEGGCATVWGWGVGRAGARLCGRAAVWGA